ncbi:MAG: DNA methyltransferase [Planctomycetota bacterium]
MAANGRNAATIGQHGDGVDALLAELVAFRLGGTGARGEGAGLYDDGRDEARSAAGSVEQLELDGLTVPRIVNEFWTARQRQGHSLHELSYRACFKAELPRFFIERLTARGDVVLDPFLGRGTTLLEAALRGRRPWGNDANPLSEVLCAPRLAPPDPAAVEVRLRDLDLADPGPDADEPDLAPFFAPGTLGALRALRRRFAAPDLDDVDRWLRMVATNRLTGHSPGFFSGRTMPPNQAVSAAAQRRLNERLDLVPPERDVRAILRKKGRSLMRDLDDRDRSHLREAAGGARLACGDARSMRAFPAASVALVVTSPPFLDVVDYAADNWLRCWFNGIDAEAVSARLSTPRGLDAWLEVMGAVLGELRRVLRPGGWVAFEVGEVRGGRLLLEEPLLPVAAAAGLEPVAVVVNAQRFTKTAHCWGVANGAKGTNTNRVLLLRRPGGRA